MDVWFTGDSHFGHTNVIDYCDRPYASADEMDADLIARWNARVAPGDTVYHVGDLSFRNPARTNDIIYALNGQIHLILGNHDKAHVRWKGLAWTGPYKEIKVGEQRIVLFHYAMRVWHRSHHGAWHLYGHSHGSLADDPASFSADVGVDARSLAPIHFEEVRELMSHKTFVPVDHHDGSRS